MIQCFTIENKPNLQQGQPIEIDMKSIGCQDYGVMSAKVVGKSESDNIEIDLWSVEFDKNFAPTCPQRIFNVPHIAIVHAML